VPRVTPNDLRRTFATWRKQRDVGSAVVAAMMGHSSTAMVDRVYGKLDAAGYRRAIARMPGGADVTAPAPAPNLHAGGTTIAQDRGEHGTTAPKREIADSVEKSAMSASYGVRAEGLEPSTSGLRVRREISVAPGTRRLRRVLPHTLRVRTACVSTVCQTSRGSRSDPGDE